MTNEPPTSGPSNRAGGYVGHAHFWDRALSRSQFVRATVGATGVALGANLWTATAVQAKSAGGVLARPIPGGFVGPGAELFHVFVPAPTDELSTITDFNGLIGAAHSQGPATRTLSDGTTTTLYADYDIRFMQGLYIGVDGKAHQGTFSFF